jgi:hypothetical protein
MALVESFVMVPKIVATRPVVVRLYGDEDDDLLVRLLEEVVYVVVHLVYAPDPDLPTGGYEEAKATLSQD